MQYEDRLGSTDEMIRTLGGTPKKSSMNTIPFSPDEGFGICDDSQLVSGHKSHYTVSSKDKISVGSLYP